MDPLVICVIEQLNDETTLLIAHQKYHNEEFNPSSISAFSASGEVTEFIASNGMRLASDQSPAWHDGTWGIPKSLYLLGKSRGYNNAVIVPTEHVESILQAVREYNDFRAGTITEF